MRCLSSLNFFDTKNVITRDGQYINLYFNFYDAHIHRRCLLSLLLIRCNTFLKELFFINTDIVAAHASIVSGMYPTNY